jgi:hypothetical protein
MTQLRPIARQFVLWMEEPVKPVSGWPPDYNLILPASLSNCVGCIRPTRGRGNAVILLKYPASRWRRPGNNCSIGVAEENLQNWCARRLHSGERPKAARNRIRSASHRPARVMLAGGAIHRIDSASADATTARDFMPVRGIGLST